MKTWVQTVWEVIPRSTNEEWGKNDTGKEGAQGSKKRGKLVSRLPLWAVEALFFMIVYRAVEKVGLYPPCDPGGIKSQAL